MKKNRIVVGLSGGVDSSVAAKFLVDQGHEVIGVFMKNWEEDGPECTAPRDVLDAEKVAKKLKIPFYNVNFSKIYFQEVFEYFLSETRAGRTPNPDILCNKFVKFGVFWEKAKELGAEFIATGHYAKKNWNEHAKKWELYIPEDKEKDQTYFLHALNQMQLSCVIFPLENLKKKEVRRIAKEAGFQTAEKKDSTGICFIGERNYSQFLQKFLKKSPGNIIHEETGKVVGKHIGTNFYTLGQRRELGVGGVKGMREAPWFIIRKERKTNELFISQDEKKLLATKLVATNLNWIAGEPPSKKFNCGARIRYRSEIVSCEVTLKKEEAFVNFLTPVRAITPGQSVVFYDGKVCLGGGEIQGKI